MCRNRPRPLLRRKSAALVEPTSALGATQASVGLRYVVQPRASNLGIIFIPHHLPHARPVGDTVTVLNRERILGTFSKDEFTREQLLNMMAGSRKREELDEFARADAARSARAAREKKALAAILKEEVERDHRFSEEERSLHRPN